MTLQLLEPYVAESLSVGSEYFINSQELENKVRDLLPSQGGAGAGFDLSASTQIIPIIDLTESAEGSNVRADLQTSLSFKSITAHSVKNQTTTIINNTGYWRVFGINSLFVESGGTESHFQLNDGSSTKIIMKYDSITGGAENIQITPYDFIVFLGAGDSLEAVSDDVYSEFNGCSRQIADINGNLVNPT